MTCACIELLANGKSFSLGLCSVFLGAFDSEDRVMFDTLGAVAHSGVLQGASFWALKVSLYGASVILSTVKPMSSKLLIVMHRNMMKRGDFLLLVLLTIALYPIDILHQC